MRCGCHALILGSNFVGDPLGLEGVQFRLNFASAFRRGCTKQVTLPTLQKKSVNISPTRPCEFCFGFCCEFCDGFFMIIWSFQERLKADLRNSHRNSLRNSNWDPHLQEEKFAQASLCRLPGARNKCHLSNWPRVLTRKRCIFGTTTLLADDFTFIVSNESLSKCYKMQHLGVFLACVSWRLAFPQKAKDSEKLTISYAKCLKMAPLGSEFKTTLRQMAPVSRVYPHPKKILRTLFWADLDQKRPLPGLDEYQNLTPLLA